MENLCKCEGYKWLIENKSLVPCNDCNPDGAFKANSLTICLGCGRDIAKRDCGCPAGTESILHKYKSY